MRIHEALPTIPERLHRLIAGHEAVEVHLGCTESRVFRVGDVYYLRAMTSGSDEPLREDNRILTWLNRFVPTPEVAHFEEADGTEYLLMTRIPGRPACELDADARATAIAYGEALRQWHHALDPAACPFVRTLDTQLRRAASRVEAGRVDPESFDAERSHLSPSDVLAALVRERPRRAEQRVVAHGDYSMPNVLFDEHLRVTGYVDVGRCGVADAHQDLAIGSRSLARNLGDAHVPTFFRAYGADPDPELIAYYRGLDELF